jgi:two-component system, chemotaxis family, sensor kinase CheA
MLDELTNNSGKITVIRNMVNKIIHSLEVKYIQNKDIQNLGELFDEMHKINSTIQSRITDLCKVPLSGVLKPIPRIIRELSRDLNKNVKLDIFGESLRIDNSLVHVCSNCLIHLVRNSVDHGIETVNERVKKNKPKIGTIKIHCSEDNNIVQISISDDGSGIDQNKIIAKAIEKGLYTQEQLEFMSEQQIFEIIFASGFSTAEKLTDVSGRGVGMDMVKSSVESCGGQIVIDSKVGIGTEFMLLLPKPKSVLIIHSLLVKCVDQCFAIPQESIFRVLRIEQDKYNTMIQNVGNEVVLHYEEALYPLVKLKKILKVTDKNDVKSLIMEILILKTKDFMYAMQVDEILDSEEIVLKELNQCFNFQGIYSGATFMGDGSIGLILNVKNIAELAGIKLNKPFRKMEENKLPLLNRNLDSSDLQNYLLFHIDSKSIYGIPLTEVFRLEEISKLNIQHSGIKKVIIYRDCIMPLFTFEKLLNLTSQSDNNVSLNESLSIIVTKNNEGYKGFIVSQVLDIALGSKDISQEIRDREGIIGNVFIQDKTVTILDIPKVLMGS